MTSTLTVQPLLYITDTPTGSSVLSSGVISTSALVSLVVTKAVIFLSWHCMRSPVLPVEVVVVDLVVVVVGVVVDAVVASL